MKKLMHLLLVVACMGHVSAQKIQTAKVPVEVLAAFHAKFPSATKEKWEFETTQLFEAEFLLNGKEVSANFDIYGKWVETETEIKTSSLPAVIQAAIKKDFASYKLKEASKIESLEHGICYEVEIEKGETTLDILYTKEGKILSKTEVEKGKEDED
jgi:hypothetical protein